MTWTDFKAMNTPTEWRARFSRNRWLLAWVGFAGLFLVMLLSIPVFGERPWFGSFITAFTAGLTMVLAILIYVHGQAANAKAVRQQMDHMQALTQKQIEALAANTNRQIQQYSQETMKVVSKLSESSLLLAKLLKRELEKALVDNERGLRDAEKRLRDSMQPKLLRTVQERAAQIAAWEKAVSARKDWKRALQDQLAELQIMFPENHI